MAIRHIFCFGDNPRAAMVARGCGWELGARSDGCASRIPRPLALLDCKWKRLDWNRHLMRAREFRPWICVVPDVTTGADLPLALSRAEQLAPHCEALMIIPKVQVIDEIPDRIGGVPVILGYSVPTRYGGTCVPLWEFGRRPVHLLGGSPRKQREAGAYLNVVSADGNMAWRLAQRCLVYDHRGIASGRSLASLDGARFSGDGPYEALRRSLMNLRMFWDAQTKGVSNR